MIGTNVQTRIEQVQLSELVQPNLPTSPEKIEISIQDPKSPKKVHYIFCIFVNPGSGDSQAALLTKLDIERMLFSTLKSKDVSAEVLIFNLRDPTSRLAGLNTVRALQEAGHTNIRIIVGGGDGSIMWMVQEMIKERVGFEQCAIGTIPFGTGNDFSRTLGWGPTEPKVLLGKHMSNFKGLMTTWADAQVEHFDVWEITIETYENGGLRQIHRPQGKKFEKRFMTRVDPQTGKEVQLTTFSKLMCNYFSFGVESRIGYGFDKGRTKSRLGNKIVYFWEGLKKLVKKTPRLNDVVDNIESLKVHQNGKEMNWREVNIDEMEFTADDFLMYPGSNQAKATDDGKVHKNVSVIKENPSVFLCLNIPSFMGGASDPWRCSKGKIGAHSHDQKKLSDFEDQKIGDGKIEILSFGGPMAMAAERFMPGQGRRLGQTRGPFIVNFKQAKEGEKPIHTYMQVDGEFYDVVAPKRVRVSLCPKIPQGKINVLVNAAKRKGA